MGDAQHLDVRGLGRDAAGELRDGKGLVGADRPVIHILHRQAQGAGGATAEGEASQGDAAGAVVDRSGGGFRNRAGGNLHITRRDAPAVLGIHRHAGSNRGGHGAGDVVGGRMEIGDVARREVGG